jgi:hypothetical protein
MSLHLTIATANYKESATTGCKGRLMISAKAYNNGYARAEDDVCCHEIDNDTDADDNIQS